MAGRFQTQALGELFLGQNQYTIIISRANQQCCAHVHVLEN